MMTTYQTPDYRPFWLRTLSEYAPGHYLDREDAEAVCVALFDGELRELVWWVDNDGVADICIAGPRYFPSHGLHRRDWANDDMVVAL